MEIFYLGISKDFEKDPDFQLGFALLKNNPQIKYIFLDFSKEVQPEEIMQFDGLAITGQPKISTTSLKGVEKLKAIGRFGVGYDNIDVKACSEKNIMCFITPEGVIRPVAVAILTFILNLSMRIIDKDNLIRTGRWAERKKYNGIGLVNKVVGSIGFGRIAQEFFEIGKPLNIRGITYDPYANKEKAKQLGVELVELNTLLESSDFVCVNCPLTEKTYHLIGEKEIKLMKPTAFLINTARGQIIDQEALTKALIEKQIQGAGLDVFEQEPLNQDDPITKLDNVILAPHSLAWTDELFAGNIKGCISRMIEVSEGKVPKDIVNPEVLNRIYPDIKGELA